MNTSNIFLNMGWNDNILTFPKKNHDPLTTFSCINQMHFIQVKLHCLQTSKNNDPSLTKIFKYNCMLKIEQKNHKVLFHEKLRSKDFRSLNHFLSFFKMMDLFQIFLSQIVTKWLITGFGVYLVWWGRTGFILIGFMKTLKKQVNKSNNLYYKYIFYIQ